VRDKIREEGRKKKEKRREEKRREEGERLPSTPVCFPTLALYALSVAPSNPTHHSFSFALTSGKP